MSLQYDEDNSILARLQREIRNPTKKTVLALIIIFLLVISPFAAGWLNSTQKGFEQQFAEHDLSENFSAGVADLTDEEVAPWLVEQGNIMFNATTPLHWEVGNFYYGVCSEEGIAGLADATYRDGVRIGCQGLADIQGKYSRDCFIASTCVVKQSAKDELTAVFDGLWATHAEAGYVRP
ncbi:MAG TPA: hypothetical protein EYQ61_10505 [Dehalococcoidia bacterium]|jgi:hypothetical protein|nr:hypothetical protein [Dehalococcoidia bacterium]HIK88488.1 hypothetical protein [Dehalococcoidia bacterium]